jgi:cell division protein FtsN
MWLLTGFLIGLGLAYYLFAKGLIPRPESGRTGDTASSAPGETAAEEVAPATGEARKSRYDFFTVLPEMEVVVPEQEVEKSQATGQPADPAQAAGSYILQVGSFQARPDAEQMKAKLALLGMVAQIQTVAVKETTWHRVRVGPVSGARQADEMRRLLADNGIDSLVLRNQ